VQEASWSQLMMTSLYVCSVLWPIAPCPTHWSYHSVIYVKTILHKWPSLSNGLTLGHCHTMCSSCFVTGSHIRQLEKVAIVMHCNLRPPDAVPVLICFNYNAYAKSEVARPICCHLTAFLLLICYVMLWPRQMTAWPWSLTLNLCSIPAVLCMYHVLHYCLG